MQNRRQDRLHKGFQIILVLMLAHQLVWGSIPMQAYAEALDALGDTDEVVLDSGALPGDGQADASALQETLDALVRDCALDLREEAGNDDAALVKALFNRLVSLELTDEAVERALNVPDNKGRYQLGSVLNQVLLHQSVIGLETKAALDKYGIKPDMIIGCAGGGSNLGGLIAPFVGEKLRGEADYEIVAVEPASCPSFTRGVYAYDFCDTGMVCPLAKMYTLGCDFIPAPNHAGGLRYHGMSPVLSQLYADGLMKAVSVPQTAVFEAAEEFARVEGILPAPESSHAIRIAIDEAKKCKETGEEKTIVFGLTGTGYFDMVAYEKFHDGKMEDYIPTDEELAVYRAKLPKID